MNDDQTLLSIALVAALAKTLERNGVLPEGAFEAELRSMIDRSNTPEDHTERAAIAALEQAIAIMRKPLKPLAA